MDDELKGKLWLRYSSVWRHVLTDVLEWPPERVDSYIEELRQQMEARINDPFDFGFFFDPASRYLFRALFDNGLHERIMDCNSDEANSFVMHQRLVRAITGGQLEREMEKKDFDWNQARRRYETERRKIEEWLVMQEKL
jgi:hypothetical protein